MSHVTHLDTRDHHTDGPLAKELAREQVKILAGLAAIEVAELTGRRLNKYTDPTEEAREGLTVEEAREIAREDPSLIWIAVSDRDLELETAAAEAAEPDHQADEDDSAEELPRASTVRLIPATDRDAGHLAVYTARLHAAARRYVDFAGPGDYDALVAVLRAAPSFGMADREQPGGHPVDQAEIDRREFGSSAFDELADAFYRETGIWPPGRDRPPAMGDDGADRRERVDRFRAFVAGRAAQAKHVCRRPNMIERQDLGIKPGNRWTCTDCGQLWRLAWDGRTSGPWWERETKAAEPDLQTDEDEDDPFDLRPTEGWRVRHNPAD